MFRDPWYLLGALPLLGLAAAAYAWGAARRARLERQLGDVPTLRRLVRGDAPRRRKVQTALRLAALASLMLALAGPQWGVELVETRTQARQVMIAVDVSLSMKAEDVKPDRLARAKQDLSLLIDELKGSRVGVMAFAGEPAIVCPLTTDSEAAKQLLAGLDVDAVPVPGTAIGTAIRRATQALSRYSGSKSLVILTDGEDHKTDPLGAAEEAAAQGVKIFAIGIGNPEGEPIPVRDENGHVTGYKKDKHGATVMSRLGEGDLAAIAQKTGGAYFRSSPGASEATEIARRALGAASDEASQGASLRLRNRFLIPLALALLLLLAEALIPEGAAAASPASAKAATLAALAMVALLPARASATAESALRRGNSLYDDSQFEPALEQYGIAGQKSPRDRRPVFNAGDALYRLQQYDKAAEAFKAVADGGGPADVRSQAYYNLGNALYQQGQYGPAVDAYRKAVTLRPSDGDARRNLAVALRRLKNPPPKKKPDQKNQKKDQQQPPPPKPQDQKQNKSGGGQNPPQPKTRPQDQQMSKEDADRIMRAVQEREKASPHNLQKAPLRKPDVEEDW